MLCQCEPRELSLCNFLHQAYLLCFLHKGCQPCLRPELLRTREVELQRKTVLVSSNTNDH